MKVILDTNVLSELMNLQGSKVVRNWVLTKPRKSLYITSITKAEILYGIAILPDGKRKQALRQAAQAMFIEAFREQILPFDSEAAEPFAEITSMRRKNGKPISQADAQIAAICLANNAEIATRNIDDFADCQIKIVNPWDV